jgi:4-diphosphocytidyl-2-C-methyl-D-erythritol kinase
VERGPATEQGCVAVRVPAKANLFLAVRGRRADGYHEIVTVLQTLSLHDEVRVAIEGPPGQTHHPAGRRHMGLRLTHDGGDGVPGGEDNLIVRAAQALGRVGAAMELETADEADRRPCTTVELAKRIPVAGGMAGGSADAAAALVALNELWTTGLDRDDLRGLAAQVGSDVPFCVVGGTALATGTGTNLAQVLCRGTFHWVVGTAAEPLETATVYQAWDRHCRPSEVEPDAVLHALRGGDAEALGAGLHNDLEPAAFTLRPELEEHKKALEDAGVLGAVLSGSGPTLLGLCEDAAGAERVAGEVRGLFDRVLVVHSPVGGPDLQRCG